MESNKHFMRIYGVYNCDEYPEWDIVATDFHDYNNGNITCIRGLAFLKNGDFDTAVELDVSRITNIIEIAYIYHDGSATINLIK